METLVKASLSYQPMYSSVGMRLQVDLSVHEMTQFSNLAYVGWLGAGSFTLSEDKDFQWYTMKHSLEKYVGPLTLGGGKKVNWKEGFEDRLDLVYLKASYRLW